MELRIIKTLMMMVGVGIGFLGIRFKEHKNAFLESLSYFLIIIGTIIFWEGVRSESC